MISWFRNYRAEAAERELERLKISHESELSRVITELRESREEYQRLVRVMVPAVQGVALPKEQREAENEPAPIVQGHFGGTPFERVKAAYMQQWEEEDAKKVKKAQAGYNFTPDGPVKQEN